MKDIIRRELIESVESIMAQYCEGCFLYTQLKQEAGRRFAHRFCISQCTVGEQIKDYGEKLC